MNAENSSNQQAASPWLCGAKTDLLIGGGLWSLPLILGTALLSVYFDSSMAMLFYVFALFCNNPHYMATIYRAYGSSDEVNKYRVFTIYVTAFVIILGLALHFVPRWVPWVFTLYLFWSPWHYTGQNYGILMMLSGRHGSRPTGLLRQLIYGCFVLSYLLWLLATNAVESMDYRVYTLGLNGGWVKPLLLTGCSLYALMALSALILIKKKLGRRVLLVAGTLLFTQSIWFTIPIALTWLDLYSVQGTFYSAGVLALLHCAQYLWVTGYYAKREALEATGRWSWKRYYTILILGGIVLFVPAPWIASRVLNHDLFESIAIVIALVNLHHFILDGAIWKLRDGAVARFLLINKPTDYKAASDTTSRKPTTSLKRLWIAALAVIAIVFAFADQVQYWLTAPDAPRQRLGWALRLNPNDSRIYYRLGLLSLSEGDFEMSLNAFKEAIELNPYNAPAQHYLGQLLMQTGDAEKVYAHYNAMTDLFRPDLAISINGGLAALEAGRPSDAIRFLEDAVNADNSRIELHQFLGRAFLEADRPEEAKIHLSYVIEHYLNENPANNNANTERNHQQLTSLYESVYLMTQIEQKLGNASQAHDWQALLMNIQRELSTIKAN